MERPDLRAVWASVFGAAYVAARAAHAEPWHARNIAKTTASEAVAWLQGDMRIEPFDITKDSKGVE